MTVGHPKRTPVASVMKSNLRARDARFSLKPFSLPASEAAHTRSNAPPQARSAMTHVMPGRVTRAPPPQVQMEKNSTIPSARRPQSTSFHRARRGPAAAFSCGGQETRGLCFSCDLPVLYGSLLAAHAALVALLVDAGDQRRRRAARSGQSQHRARGWGGWG